MASLRMGELLSRIVGLGTHDVDEILHEQAYNPKRFGSIALSWGLCEPKHVWQAWTTQLDHRLETVVLPDMGIDAQAAERFSNILAWHYHAIPIRHWDNTLVIATAEPWKQRAMKDLPLLFPKHLKFVLTNQQDLLYALAQYYPSTENVA